MLNDNYLGCYIGCYTGATWVLQPGKTFAACEDPRRMGEDEAVPEMQQITLKVLRFEERDKRLVIKEAQIVA